MDNKTRLAMQQALEALDVLLTEPMAKIAADKAEALLLRAAPALREVLAEQAEQEPVAKPMDKAERENWYKEVIATTEDVIAEKERIAEHRALITRNNAIIAASQQPVKEVELTDDEIDEVISEILMQLGDYPEICRAVIAAHKEKNK